MDNMRVHHSNVSKEAYKELELTPIFNIAYSPQFNPIESVFSMIKSNYKKLLLKSLIEKHKVRTRHLIKMRFQSLT
jgi:transposase